MVEIERDVGLASKTTLGLGGPATHYTVVRDETDLPPALEFAAQQNLPVLVVGGGSNLVVADHGFAGLVVQIANRGLDIATSGATASVRIAAGEPWDPAVAQLVAGGLSGIECLSGIPGLAGATPIQNVGAYGQDTGQVLRRLRAFDRDRGRFVELTAQQCALGYRDSALRRSPGRWVVTEIELALAVGGTPAIRYGELTRALGDGDRTPERVREVVLQLRRRKSMVLDPEDPNRRSAGSFFTNPIVTAHVAEHVARVAAAAVPQWPTQDGRVKLAAGWLVEAAGFTRGTRRGAVGLSSAHALALVHHGGGTTDQLVELAREIRDAVRDRFGVELRPEPVLIGLTL